MLPIKRLRDHVLRALLPWACAGCRSALACLKDEGFCGRCWLRIPRIQGTVCRSCGIPLKDGGASCFTCRQHPFSVVLRAATTYAGPIPPAIHRFKYAGRQSLARPFGALLAYAWACVPEFAGTDWLIPVPLHSAAERVRGYNQAFLLAKALGDPMGIPVREDCIRRARKTRPQFRLTKEERLINMANAFAAVPHSPLVKGKRIVLVDDVGTTGATLSAASHVLRRSGAAWVGALVLARDL